MTIDKYYGSLKDDKKLGVFYLENISNPNTNCRQNLPNDTYNIRGDAEEQFKRIWDRLGRCGAVISLEGEFPEATAEGKRKAIYHRGDSSVTLCSWPSVLNNLQLSVYNPEFEKRIETLKVLEEAFQPLGDKK